MAEIVPGRVISGAREISRDTLMERAACAATRLGVGSNRREQLALHIRVALGESLVLA